MTLGGLPPSLSFSRSFSGATRHVGAMGLDEACDDHGGRWQGQVVKAAGPANGDAHAADPPTLGRGRRRPDYKLDQQSQVEIRSKKRKSHAKKITGFQFAPSNPSEVMITSADSQIRIFDGVNMIHKYRGFRNTSSQISASFTWDGKFVVCASEDSHVYVWKRDMTRNASSGGKSKSLTTTRSHEHFYCKDVSVAIPWPGCGSNCPLPSLASSSGRLDSQSIEQSDYDQSISGLEDNFPSGRSNCPPLPKKSSSENTSPPQEENRYPSRSDSGIGSSSSSISSSPSVRSDPTSNSSSFSSSWGWSNNKVNNTDSSNAWGLVVVAAGLGGDIKIYQNFGLPLRLSRQTNLF